MGRASPAEGSLPSGLTSGHTPPLAPGGSGWQAYVLHPLPPVLCCFLSLFFSPFLSDDPHSAGNLGNNHTGPHPPEAMVVIRMAGRHYTKTSMRTAEG